MANINKKMKQNIENFKNLQSSELTALEVAKKREKRQNSVRYALMLIVYAAVYFGITYLCRGFSYNVPQFRIAEIMVSLIFFDPAALPGISFGCFFANVLGPGGFGDAVIGTCATAFGLYIIKWWAERNGKPYIGLILYAFLNACMIAFELSYSELYGANYSLFKLFGGVFIGEVVCAVIGGMVLYIILSKYWKDIVSETEKG